MAYSDDQDWVNRTGLPAEKRHARLRPLETWDEIPSPNAIEWGGTEGAETTATMVVRSLGRLVIHWHGHNLTGISLKGL